MLGALNLRMKLDGKFIMLFTRDDRSVNLYIRDRFIAAGIMPNI